MIIDRSELLAGRVIFAGASHIRPSIGSFPFYRRYSVRSGHPVALDRVNLSRAPHCPAAFSLGNEVMETRLDLPFLRRTTCNFTPSFFLASSPLFHSANSLPVAFLHPFFLSACHRPHPRFVAIVLGSLFRRRAIAFIACDMSSEKGVYGIHISTF